MILVTFQKLVLLDLSAWYVSNWFRTNGIRYFQNMHFKTRALEITCVVHSPTTVRIIFQLTFSKLWKFKFAESATNMTVTLFYKQRE